MQAEVFGSLRRLPSHHSQKARDIRGVVKVPGAHVSEHDGLVDECSGKPGNLELDPSPFKTNANGLRRQLECERRSLRSEENLLTKPRRFTPTSPGRNEEVDEHAVFPP